MTINVNAIYNQFVNSLLAKLPINFNFNVYNNTSAVNSINSSNADSDALAVKETPTVSFESSLASAVNSTQSYSLTNVMNAIAGSDLMSFTNTLGGTSSLTFDYLLKLYEQQNASDDEVAQNITDAISEAAEKYELDPNLIKAVIRAESNFDTDVVSKSGAMGLMQLMPRTAESLGVTDAFNVFQNVDGGAAYLSKMLDRFGGDEELALAAYNAGAAAVKKYGGIPPYTETQNYVPKVIDYKEQYILEQYKAALENSKK